MNIKQGNALVGIIVFPPCNTKMYSINRMKYTFKYTIQNVGFGKIFFILNYFESLLAHRSCIYLKNKYTI